MSGQPAEQQNSSQKNSKSRKVTVLGSGSWGTALAEHLARLGNPVWIWGREAEVLKAIQEQQVNPKYFPGIRLNQGIKANPDLRESVENANVVVVAVPSSAVRAVASEVKNVIPAGALVISTAKGLEESTLKTMSDVLAEELGQSGRVMALSGPSFALEVLKGLPTAVTIAGKSAEFTNQAAEIFRAENFRAYTSDDVIGVEMGGVLKNVIALAAGATEGLGMGANARAAIITRGLAEMQRIVVAMGGKAITVSGLSGIGDLFLTATGELSRNRTVGLRLGKGERLEDILASIGQVAEGVITAPKIAELTKRINVASPIVEQINAVLQGRKKIEEVVKALLSRVPSSEFETR